MTPYRPPSQVKWYRRLDVRLSVMLVAALLVFEYFSQPVYDSVLRLLGYQIDSEEVIIIDRVAKDGSFDMDTYAQQMADLLSQPADALQDVAEGSVADVLRLKDEAFVVLDAGGQVVVRSAGLPWEVGSSWPYPQQSHTELAAPDTGDVLAHAIYVPSASTPGGNTFVLLVTGLEAGKQFVCPVTGYTQEVDSKGEPTQVFLSEADYELQNRRQDRIVSVVWFVAMALIAALLALLIAGRLTRRLARMSTLASRPLPCGRIPGPFDESGGDEVSSLAGTMNGMRERVNQLLDDIARHEGLRREWLAQVSHDLRTPLTALHACLDRAELALKTPRPETLYQEVPDLLAVAKLDIDRVESLANDLFEIARLESRDALNLEPVPPGELVRQTVRCLDPLAAKKGVKLQVRLESDLPILSADGRRLMRALENLLRNAIQHAVAFVWIRVHRVDDELRFEVRDDGPGFPEQEGVISFDELRSRRSREDSAGLGLTVTQKVAEAHDGSVGAHNAPEGGAVVWFALPRGKDDLDDSPEDPLESEASQDSPEELRPASGQ